MNALDAAGWVSGRQSWARAVSLMLALACLNLAAGSALAQTHTLRLAIRDQDTGQPLPARLTLRRTNSDAAGTYFYFQAQSSEGSAVTYDKQNWINSRSIERHTTVSPHPVAALLPEGSYELIVEHGKAYVPHRATLQVDADQRLDIALKRWCDPAARFYYSGDTHLHRTVDELRNVVLAEDLNVALPLTNWVTIAQQPPTRGDKNIPDAALSNLIEVDPLHVIWPQNTEYEIFSVQQRPHTLGALFVLGHSQQLPIGVPPWQPVIAEASRQHPRVVFDMDKLDWPFAMLLPTLVPNALYELSNNHVWQTEFAFRSWNSPAPAYMQPPYGGRGGGHRQWLDYTLGMYYSLLNCGLRLPPSAGTANGVHPVPAGFGRVYVHQPEGFQFDRWMQALKAGRSFVTTGPMLYATANGYAPGEVFTFSSQNPASIQLEFEASSLEPLLYGEIIINGRPEQLLRPQNASGQVSGVYYSRLAHSFQPERSGWVAIRIWQQSADGQVRFAHTAPWYFELDQQPVLPRGEEKEYLVQRMQAELARSGEVVEPAARAEYAAGLNFYQALPVWDDTQAVSATARQLRDPLDRTRWSEMFQLHRFTPWEVRAATGLSLSDSQALLVDQAKSAELDPADAAPADAAPVDRQPDAVQAGLRLYPYPGGRHPRRGFLDGAVNPQRETKLSIFPPWDKAGESGYVVVDLPEAIFCNLGLIYLAHQHIPTIWDQQKVKLEPLEWQAEPDQLALTRTLPNGIRFASTARRDGQMVRMRLELTNGTPHKLTGLRVQVCTMLGGLEGFNLQEPLEAISEPPLVAVRSRDASRWLLTSWTPNHRVWQNPPVPCIHSDPIFPDCEPGQTVEVNGQLRFYEGDDVRGFIQQLR